MHQLDELDSPSAMQAAIDEALEAAASGRDFASRYSDGHSVSFRRSNRWIVRVGSVELDSKPLVAAAYENQFGRKLTEKLHGGCDAIARALDKFGYKMEPRTEDGWVTPVGAAGTKKEFAKLYGGSTMGGIQPSKQTNNILIYSDPSIGTTYGYNFDGWSADGNTFSYTGEGRRGPQTLTGGNGAILHHQSRSRALRLFVADGYVGKSRSKKRIYVGEFVLDDAHPYSVEDAADEDGVMRTVYVFHLIPAGDALQRIEDYSAAPMTPQSQAVAEMVPLERHLVPGFETTGSGPASAEKREQALVEHFIKELTARGHGLSRWKITPPESTRPLYSDIYDETTGILYEAKAKSTRNHVRLGLGQILDYRRYTPAEVKAFSLLLPAEPHWDLLSLLRSQDIGAVWPNAEAGGFSRLTSNGVDAF